MIKKTLYFGNPAYLSLRNKQLVIKMPAVEKSQNVADIIRAESITTKPIEDLEVVVLDHQQITITQGLLEALLAIDEWYADEVQKLEILLKKEQALAKRYVPELEAA